MARVVTDYLDNIVKKYPDKIAFVDENRSITFSQLQNGAYHIANKLHDNKISFHLLIKQTKHMKKSAMEVKIICLNQHYKY